MKLCDPEPPFTPSLYNRSDQSNTMDESTHKDDDTTCVYDEDVFFECKIIVDIKDRKKRKRAIELDSSEVCDGSIDSALNALPCGGYEDGCCCTKCLRQWSRKEPWNRRPRCLMCPAMCNEVGMEKDGVCGIHCKTVLCELMTGGSSKPCGYPFGVFKKTRWAEIRGDAM